MARIAELDSRTLERTLRKGPIVILPVGALEAHGPHLPLSADTIQADLTAVAAAELWQALVAPPISYGACTAARRFPGTVSVPAAELERTTRTVLAELVRMGARRLLVLSGHAERGHMSALREAAEAVQSEHRGVRIAVLSDYDFVYELRGSEAPSEDGHGGLLETSRLLALAPELVGAARPVGRRRRSPFVVGPATSREWPESVDGDTRPASAELGRRVQAHVLKRLDETVPSILGR
ncbi:MAG TPA: creatininase family protein [Thermoplasmata archaeon]|nr:creatininase family protein [Thermoplasmata archaeon]